MSTMDLPPRRIYIVAWPAGVAVVPLSISLFILVSNVMVVIGFKRMRNLQIQHYYMIGLIVADMLTLAPFSVSVLGIFQGYVVLSARQCNGLGAVMVGSIETTACIHSVMCIDKCVSVAKPLRYRLFEKSKSSTLAIVLILILCFVLPTLMNVIFFAANLMEFDFEHYMVTCLVSPESLGFIISGLLFAFIPLTIQFVTHVIMFRTVRKMRGRTRKNMIRAIRTVGLTVGTYFLCWMPTAVYLIWNILPVRAPAGWFSFMTGEILLANSGMSCVIYAVSLPNFRDGLTINACKKKLRSQIHPI